MFRPLLEKMIELKKQQAEALGYPDCPYDALLDDFEPDELTANIRRVLGDLREQLVPLVAAIGASPRTAEGRDSQADVSGRSPGSVRQAGVDGHRFRFRRRPASM